MTAPAQPDPVIPEPVEDKPAQAKPEIDWKAEARKHEARAKANQAAAEKLAALEEAQKSEQQKAEESRLAAERRAQEAEAKALRLEVALDKGVPGHLRGYVQGNTPEEIEASAAQVLADFAAAQPQAPTTAGSIDQGARTPPLPLNGDPFERALRNAVGIQ
jgi:hypothetical protein